MIFGLPDVNVGYKRLQAFVLKIKKNKKRNILKKPKNHINLLKIIENHSNYLIIILFSLN
jgi:hypothetical protein